MSTLVRVAGVLIMLILGASQSLIAQTIKGKVIDSLTKEPIAGATICCGNNKCMSNADGEFSIANANKNKISVSYIGYQSITTESQVANPIFALQQTSSLLQEIVLSANRDAIKRSEAPVAISSISAKQLQDTKPITIDQVLNKVSGVYMVNLGNEQHSMSIRQPMTTKGLYLYLEDGIPIRTTGLFNHNALLEMNMAAVKTIEVLKGPSSSLYGSEAIGGAVNFITYSPTATPVAKVSLQGNDIGYKRADIQTGLTKGKWGFVLNGYYATKRNSFIDYTDFNKTIVTAGIDYKFSDKTTLTNRITLMHYYSDMTGGIDSAKFASRSFGSNYTFTYRKVDALRYRSSLSTQWNENSKTSVSLIYRDNTIMQNPAYGIKDDYRRL
ncbi:MAG TPA: TonB-dependent receptor plug domain-containing protein, partial [Chitinophagaceae bacterium]|nr:TonB-dependent receptor plug domain-containing protein [Chitinophagaceae bacterium]